MSLPRLFVAIDPAAPDRARIDGDGVRHVAALRLRPGDSFAAITAPGEERQATIINLARGVVECRLGARLERPTGDPTGELVLALGLADEPQRLDFVVEKATELGATRIVLFRAARSQRAALGAQRLARWQRIARSACEQCGRTRPPAIAPPIELAELVESLGAPGLTLLFSPGAPSIEAVEMPRGLASIAVVIGPEGGLTADETARLVAAGVRAMGLGARTLRFDTAALAGLVIAAPLLAGPDSPLDT